MRIDGGMTLLIAVLSTGQGTWNHVAGLIKSGQFEKAILVTNDFGVKKFHESFKDIAPELVDFVVVNFDKPAKELIKDMSDQLREKVTCFEAAVNFVSGGGKEHMAFVSCLMKSGIAFRLVAMTQDGLDEL